MSCGVGCRLGSDLALLWLWRRLAATAPIRPLAWEPPYATGVAQEIAKRQNKQTNKKLSWELRCGVVARVNILLCIFERYLILQVLITREKILYVDYTCDHFTTYTNIESCFIPEISIKLNANYTSNTHRHTHSHSWSMPLRNSVPGWLTQMIFLPSCHPEISVLGVPS